MGTVMRYKDWKKGMRCTECGSPSLSRKIVYNDRIESKDGSVYERSIEDNNVVYKKFTCNECGTVLLKAPS